MRYAVYSSFRYRLIFEKSQTSFWKSGTRIRICNGFLKLIWCDNWFVMPNFFQVQSYKFIPLVYQIASRMGSSKDGPGPQNFQVSNDIMLRFIIIVDFVVIITIFAIF